MNINKDRILGLNIILAVILIAGIAYFAILPKWEKAGRLQVELDSMYAKKNQLSPEQKAKQISLAKERLSQVEEDLKLLSETTNALKSKIIQERAIPLATLEIEELADKAKIDLVLVKPMESTLRGQYELVPIEVRFESSYKDLIKFLSHMETSSSIVAVKNIDIRKVPLKYPLLDIRLTPWVVFASTGEQFQMNEDDGDLDAVLMEQIKQMELMGEESIDGEDLEGGAAIEKE